MDYTGKKVIIRSNRAGVFFGEIAEKNGQNIVLKDVRRLWRWDGACSISEIALNGVQLPEKCKFAVTNDTIEFFDVIEIIPCTTEAIHSINGVEVWKIKK